MLKLKIIKLKKLFLLDLRAPAAKYTTDLVGEQALVVELQIVRGKDGPLELLLEHVLLGTTRLPLTAPSSTLGHIVTAPLRCVVRQTRTV